ncbi:MAG TPA: hypothetical protein VM427_07720 [Patescibacteria group bacterium]|nr:hypothetical protein [Patescibacteria group bacterium]
MRRLLGGGEPASPGGEAGEVLADSATIDEEERARELELARFDQERVSELVRRQQRYAARSWTPPPEGGDRRADDTDADAG